MKNMTILGKTVLVAFVAMILFVTTAHLTAIVNFISTNPAVLMFSPCVLFLMLGLGMPMPFFFKLDYYIKLEEKETPKLKMSPILKENIGDNCDNCGANSWKSNECGYCGSKFKNILKK